MIIQRLSELRGQKPPGRGCSRELGLGTSWSRFGLTHTVWILASLSVPGGFCNISHLCGPSLPQGTCGGLGALRAFHYLAFILRPVTICAQGTNLAALPRSPALFPHFSTAFGPEMACPSQSQSILSSCTFFPILSTKFSVFFFSSFVL